MPLLPCGGPDGQGDEGVFLRLAMGARCRGGFVVTILGRRLDWIGFVARSGFARMGSASLPVVLSTGASPGGQLRALQLEVVLREGTIARHLACRVERNATGSWFSSPRSDFEQHAVTKGLIHQIASTGRKQSKAVSGKPAPEQGAELRRAACSAASWVESWVAKACRSWQG